MNSQPVTRYLGVIFLVFLIAFLSFWTYQSPRFQAFKRDTTLRFSELVERIMLPYRIAELSKEDRDTELVIPIQGLAKRNIADSWGGARDGGRLHEGIDMFAKRGTPVYSATRGYVLGTGINALGGNVVFIVGPGGVRYYYAHLDSVAEGIEFGKEVATTTIIGFVGNTGNAGETPPHLHFGMYRRGPENPYDLLVPRVN